jgi:hypothetical protein
MKARLRTPAFALALALAIGPVARADDERDPKAEQEALVKRLVELLEKTIAEAEQDDLDRTDPSDAGEAEAVAEIASRLDRSRISVHFDDVAFHEAVDFLREATGLNLVVTPRAREAADEAKRKIKLQLKAVKTRDVLELVLGQTDARLRYGIRRGVLVIGTLDDWKDRLILDVIPVEDLLYAPPDFPAPDEGLRVLDPKRRGK